MEKMPEYILERIREAKEKRLKKLDLREGEENLHYELTHVPNEVFELDHLEELNLSQNKIKSIPRSITKLRNLTSLNLMFNKLSALPESLFKLECLNTLNISFNKIKTVSNGITKLQNLTALDLGRNPLNEIPEVICELQNLISLHLSDIDLSAVPNSISRLRNLKYLNLHSNKLSVFPEAIVQLENLEVLNLGGNRISSIPPSITQLQKLKELYLWGNEITFVPEIIFELRNLSALYLNRNQLTTIPDQITNLENLQELYLWNNRFESIPDIVYKLISLEILDFENADLEVGIDKKNEIKEVSSKILQLGNLKRLNLSNNPIVNPPPEVVAEGVEAIKNYFRQLEAEGTDHLYEAKLLIIGEGGAGKTSLAKKIENPEYELCEEDSTKGIEVIRWDFQMENGQPFRVNIWDFGGQEIYHATHQFFLTKRSLYLLVADTRKEDTDFYYWLNAVELLSDNSPLLVVKNEKQDRQREINVNQLRGQFSNLKETLATNLATNRGLDEILKEIKHYISRLPQVGAPLPKTWVKVREALEKDSQNHISLEEYLDICGQNGFGERKDKLQLSGYLHDLGVCLHFQDDPVLKNKVILKPKWGTDAVYKVLDNQTVIDNLGKFNRHDLAHIWHEAEYAEMQDELLRLMINFKLAYQIPNSEFYIAPQLLTENQPDYEWDETDNLILRYTYESFMPKGILTQFIVAMHKLIAGQKYVWRSGVILEKGQTKAEVIEYYGKREIKIRVSGKHKKDLLTIVAYELDEIHASYRRLKYSKLIPCNCAKCKNSQEPHFYRFEVLQQFVDDRQEHIQCQKSYQMVDVRGLIEEVIDRRGLVDKNRLVVKPIRDQVFISYSHKDSVWLEQLQTMLAPLKRKRAVSVWADTDIQVGAKWRDRIEQALASAKVAVLLVSRDFLNSDFIAEHELPPLLDAAEKEGLTILWVAVSHCLHEETEIAAYQAANNPAEPLNSLSPSELDQVLADISKKIKEAVNR